MKSEACNNFYMVLETEEKSIVVTERLADGSLLFGSSAVDQLAELKLLCQGLGHRIRRTWKIEIPWPSFCSLQTAR